MSLNVVSTITGILGVPITAVPVGLTIYANIQSFRPKIKLKKWSIRIEQISAIVASNGDMIMPEEMEKFLEGLQL
jgi:hypothetical protein